MPDPNRFDSGHALLPVRAVNGDVHDVAIPDGTSLESVHSALSNDPKYLPDFSTKPTAAGAVENSAQFRRSASDAWNAVSKGGNAAAESGYSVEADGGTSNIHTEVHPQTSGIATAQHDKISYQPDDFGINHTHPSSSSDRPSSNDVEAAKKIKKNIWVTSRTGLWNVDPNGKVTQVYDNSDWMTKTGHEPKRK